METIEHGQGQQSDNALSLALGGNLFQIPTENRLWRLRVAKCRMVFKFIAINLLLVVKFSSDRTSHCKGQQAWCNPNWSKWGNICRESSQATCWL